MRRFLLTLILLCLAALPASAVQVCDNAWFTTATTGAGTITSSGAVSGAQTMLQCGLTDGQVTRYRIFDGAAYEVGSGTVGGTSTTLTRVVTESSNADAAISLSGTATVIITALKADLPTETTPIDSTVVPANDYWVILEGGSVLERALIGSQLATTTETLTGTATDKFITPDGLAASWEKGANEASAGTVALGEGYLFHITGTTTITDIDWDVAKDGRCAALIFDGILTLTHHATTLILPGGANILTQAGDFAIVCQDSSDNVIVPSYERRAWLSKPPVDVQTFTSTGAGTWTKPIGGQTMCKIDAWGGGGSGGKGAAAAAAAGGGGGGHGYKIVAMSTLGATEAVSVGTGGTAQTVASTNGNAGTSTSFGTVAELLGRGGGGGGGAGATGNGGGGGGGRISPGSAGVGLVGGVAGNPTLYVAGLPIGFYGGNGGAGVATGIGFVGGNTDLGGAGGGGSTGDATSNNGAGGDSIWGGGGGGAGAEDSAPGAGIGGTSVNGGAGGAGAFDAGVGTSGSQPGGGGGGSETGNSGAGGNGQVRVTCW